MKIINYFREVLVTLKDIEQHLARIAGCVQTGDRGRKDQLTIRHKNDGY